MIDFQLKARIKHENMGVDGGTSFTHSIGDPITGIVPPNFLASTHIVYLTITSKLFAQGQKRNCALQEEGQHNVFSVKLSTSPIRPHAPNPANQVN
jgi:hypothetical protein